MPKQVSWYDENVSPINWHRAFLSGMCGSLILMSFIDIFYMAGLTPFCFENYVGSLILMKLYSTHIWTIGFFAMLVIGGVFGLLYGFMFEFVYMRSSAKLGIIVGFYHAVVAAVFMFPFFQVVEAQGPVQMYPYFGFFGGGLGVQTPLILLFAHLIFGACVGTFYGPVRMARMRARFEEPEDTVYHENLYNEAS